MATEKGDSPTPLFCSKTRKEKYATLYNMVLKKKTVFSIMTRFSLTDDPHGFVCDIFKKKLKNMVFNRSATVKLSEAGGVSKWYYDQKMTSFFSFRFYKSVCFTPHWQNHEARILSKCCFFLV